MIIESSIEKQIIASRGEYERAILTYGSKKSTRLIDPDEYDKELPAVPIIEFPMMLVPDETRPSNR